MLIRLDCFVRIALLAFVACCAAATAPTTRKASQDPARDLVLRHGKVVDGSGNPWFYGDVLVQGGRIAAVGAVPPDIVQPGAVEFDATGLIIAPGFIDVH